MCLAERQLLRLQLAEQRERARAEAKVQQPSRGLARVRHPALERSSVLAPAAAVCVVVGVALFHDDGGAPAAAPAACPDGNDGEFD